MELASERQRLILSFSDINALEEDIRASHNSQSYASSDETFHLSGKTIYENVIDEIEPSMKMMCGTCFEWGLMPNFYNPFYTIPYIGLFFKYYIGALLHWLIYEYFPVKKRENKSEKLLRKRAIYFSFGMAIISIAFETIVPLVTPGNFGVKNEYSIILDLCVITINLVYIKSVSEELSITLRIFNITAWIMAISLILLAAFKTVLTTEDWTSVGGTFISYVEAMIYIYIAIHSLKAWDHERMNEYNTLNHWKETRSSIALIIILMGVMITSGYIIRSLIRQS